MRSNTKILVSLFVIACQQSAANGAIINTIGINMQAHVSSFDLGTADGYEEDALDYFDSRTSINQEVAELEHVGNINTSNALVTLSAEGSVGGGFLKAKMFGIASANVGGENAIRSGRAEIQNARVNLSYTDILTIRDLDNPGAKIIMVGSWTMIGDLNATTNTIGFEYGARAAVSTSAYVTVLGGPTQQAYAAESDIAQNKVKVPFPAAFPAVMVTRGGFPYTFTTTMELRAGALAQTSAGSLSARATGFFDNDYLHTLRWGGITSVTNADTGEPIPNWSVTSESGFDYSRPYPVPEPSSAMLLLSFGLLIGRRSGRRGCNQCVCAGFIASRRGGGRP